MRAEEASQALVLWLGFGRAAWPQRDDAAIAAAVGPDRAPSVLETLRALESDFYASDALIIAPDLVAMGDRAAQQFRARHPELSDEAVNALRWAYTFDWK